MADALDEDRVPRNIASKVKPPTVSKTKMRVWGADQLRAFLAQVRADRLYAAWYVACTTGMRRAEVLGLRWADVDLDAERLTVAQTATLVAGKIVFGPPKTEGSGRTMSVDPATIAVLRAHRKRQAEERLTWGSDYGGRDLLFAMENGDPINPETFSDMFGRHARVAGLPPIRVHDVRHSYATAALEAGIPAKVVSERLGHSGIAITLDRYSHVRPKLDEEAAETVANLILGTG